jgi:flavin-binding protein dodecin
VLEVRVKNLKPIAVTEREDSMDQAVKGAIIKAKASLDSVLGKLNEH